MTQEKFIWTAKVGDKGQIVIPKEARQIFEIKKRHFYAFVEVFSLSSG